MPTGYTSKLYDGEEQSVNDFILECSRAFGAMIDLRDTPEAPIPTEFKPQDSYYTEQLPKAKERLAYLKSKSHVQLEDEAEELYQDALATWRKTCIEKQELRERYIDMLEEVKKWQPPSEEHEGLKKFMLSQLTESIEHDCSMDFYRKPKRLTGAEYRKREIEQAERLIKRCEEAIKEERERAEGKTRWVQQLIDSLPEKVTADA